MSSSFGTSGQCFVRIDLQNGSISHWYVISKPALSNPRSNPPIPENKDAKVSFKHGLLLPFRSAAAALSAVSSRVPARLWFRTPILQPVSSLDAAILVYAFYPAAYSGLFWHSNRPCCFWDDACHCLSYNRVRAKSTREQTRLFSTLAEQHLDFLASLSYATGIDSPSWEARDVRLSRAVYLCL